MATYEGKWRCTFCSVVNRGRDMSCASCGARRGADVEFFLDKDAPTVTGHAQLREAGAGPDWLCETCGGSNRSGTQTCQTCGAPIGNSTFREVIDGAPSDFREKKNSTQGDTGQEASHTRDDKYHDNAAWTGSLLAGESISKRTSPLGIFLFFAGVLLLLVFVTLRDVPTQPKDGSSHTVAAPQIDQRYSLRRGVELVVERVEWERTIEIEEYRQVTDEDWEDLVPSDAKLISQRQDVHHYDRVKVGSHIVPEYYTERVKTGYRTETEYYTDEEYGGTESYQCGTRNKGNGYFEDVYCTRPVYRTVTKTRSKLVDDYQTVTRTRNKVIDDYKDVPVYQTKIKYSVKRWVPVDRAVERGTDLTPYWPKVTLNPTRREARRWETYYVFLQDVQSLKKYKREASAFEFTKYSIGIRCEAQVDGFDQIVTFTPPAEKDPHSDADIGEKK